jgi:hypothetical protein
MLDKTKPDNPRSLINASLTDLINSSYPLGNFSNEVYWDELERKSKVYFQPDEDILLRIKEILKHLI